MDNQIMNTGMRFEFKTDLRKSRRKLNSREIRIKKEPLLRQNLVLAYQIQELFEREKAKKMGQVGQWLHTTHARISQIMNLLLLAPDIQEQLLFSDEQKVLQLTEHRVRKIPMEVHWAKQKEMWNEICRKLVSSPHTE